MTGSADAARLAVWHAGAVNEEELAAALACDVHDVRLVLAHPGFQAERGSARDCSPTNLAARHRVGLAISMALHSRAGLGLAAAADVISGTWPICDSTLATLDFFPAGGGEYSRGAKGRPGDERDPFVLFAPYATEAMTIPAIDEFVDVMDGRRIFWKRPRRNAYRLACELHRHSEATARDTPALPEEYLEILLRLREPVDHVSEWVGTVAEGRFRPRPDRFVEPTPTMREGIDLRSDPHRVAESYGTMVSVNVSLAARSMKRRALGLTVTDPAQSNLNSATREGMSRP